MGLNLVKSRLVVAGSVLENLHLHVGRQQFLRPCQPFLHRPDRPRATQLVRQSLATTGVAGPRAR